MNIEIFTGPNCSWCAAAKTLLAGRGQAFVEYDISDPAHFASFAERLPRHRSIPQIFIDGQHIGGYEDLRIHLSRA